MPALEWALLWVVVVAAVGLVVVFTIRADGDPNPNRPPVGIHGN